MRWSAILALRRWLSANSWRNMESKYHSVENMNNAFINQELELAAKRTLTRITGLEDTLKPLYLQPDRALFLAEKLCIVLKVYMAEKILQHEYDVAQPGDPLLDIAVVTLWDHGLTDLLLKGYSCIANNEETKQLLSLYRLLRHLAEIPWLLERGFKELAARNIRALEKS